MDFPRTVDEITPEWLTQVLRESGAIRDASVDSFEVSGLKGGMASEINRVTLAYDSQEPNSPDSVIAKFSLSDDVQRKYIDGFGSYETEVRAYQRLAHLGDMRLPIMHFADYDSDSGYCCLLIEDLAHLRAIRQIDGQGFEDAKSSVQYLARLHSKWWNKSELLEFDWLRNAADSSTFQKDFDTYNDNVGALLEVLSGHISTELASVIQKFAPKVVDVCKKLAREPMTLNHGDFRLDNLFFDDSKQNAGVVVPVDWQRVRRARAGTDLGIFLMTSLKLADRRNFENQLLAIYYEELVAGGVTDLSYDDLMTDIKLGMLVRLITMAGAMGNLNIDNFNEAAFKELGERLEILVDWNCDEVIPK